MLRAIPNTFTLLNLASGCMGIVFAFNDLLEWAGLAILLGGVMDFLDGFTARLLKAHSSIGKDLDSLADVVTFGVLPSLILFQLIRIGNGNYFTPFQDLSFAEILMSSAALIYVLGAALRLAVFNVDESQSTEFKGIPSPAAAFFVAAIPMVLGFQFQFNFYAQLDATSINWFLGMYNLDAYDQFLISTFRSPTFIIGLTIALAVLMNIRLPFMSLKFKSFRWRGNGLRYVFLILSLLVVLYAWAHYVIRTGSSLTLEWSSIQIVLILYVLLSLIQAFIPKNEIPS